MSEVVAYIPSGFSDESKAVFINGVKEMFCERCGFKLYQSVVMIQEFRPENACEDGKNRMNIIVYTTVGKSAELKLTMAKEIDRIIKEAFGDKSLETFVIYEEHDRGNVGVMGKITA